MPVLLASASSKNKDLRNWLFSIWKNPDGYTRHYVARVTEYHYDISHFDFLLFLSLYSSSFMVLFLVNNNRYLPPFFRHFLRGLPFLLRAHSVYFITFLPALLSCTTSSSLDCIVILPILLLSCLFRIYRSLDIHQAFVMQFISTTSICFLCVYQRHLLFVKIGICGSWSFISIKF